MAKTVSPIRIGVWGVGRHAERTIIPAILRSPYFHLHGIHTRKVDVRDRVASEHGCIAWTSEDAMLRDPALQVVYLATPTGLHAGHAMAVLGSGKHLICEKSLSHDGKSGLNLIAEARARNLVLCEGFMYLFHPRFVQFVELVGSGRLGAVRNVVSSFCIPPLEHPGFRDRPSLGGGAFLDVGCYTLSALLALVPKVPAVRFVHYVADSLGELDIGGMAVLDVDGSMCAVSVWAYQCAYKNDLTVIGEGGIAHLDFVFAKGGEPCRMLRVRDRYGREDVIDCGLHDSFAEMLAAVHRATENLAVRESLLLQAERQAALMYKVQTYSP